MKRFLLALAAISMLAPASHALNFGRIMLTGDSLTAGGGTGSPNAYRQPLFDLLTTNNHTFDLVGPNNWGSWSNPSWTPDNQHAGNGGWGMEHILTQSGNNLNTWLPAYNPDTMVFFAGGNDWWRWQSTWATNATTRQQAEAWMRTQYQQVLDLSFAQNANMRFVFASYPRNNSGDATRNQWYGELNTLVQTMVAEQQTLGRDVRYVDLYGMDPAVATSSDLVHLSAAGSAEAANRIYNGLTANPVPEPATLAALSLAALLKRSKRRAE